MAQHGGGVFDQEHRRTVSHYELDDPAIHFSNPLDDNSGDGSDDDGELAFTRDLTHSWWSGIPRQNVTSRYRREALIGENGEGKVWMAGGSFTGDGRLFIAYGDDKQVTAFDMASDHSKVLVKREDGINAAVLSPDSQQLCVADEGGALVMYDLKTLLHDFDGSYDVNMVETKLEDGGATIWSEHVPHGFEHGRGHQRRHHNCTCDACGKMHSRLAASLPGLAKKYEVDGYDVHNEPDTPYHAQAEHMCGCAACDETLQKIEGRLETIKRAYNAKAGKDEDYFRAEFEASLQRKASANETTQSTQAPPPPAPGKSDTAGPRPGQFTLPGQFALGDHGCGCSACAETLSKLESDVTVLKGSLDGTPLDSAVCYLSHSSDGRLLAVVNKERLKAGIRDSADGKLLHVVDFPMMECSNGWSITPTCALSFSNQTILSSTGLLALAGGGDKSEEVAIYTVPRKPVGERFTEEEVKRGMQWTKSIQLRDGMQVSNVALSPIGHQVAIGATDGTVWLVSTDPAEDPVDSDEKHPKRKDFDREISPPTGVDVSCLVYSHDGLKVAATWETGRCVVFDVKTTAPLAEFMHRSLYGGLVLGFSPKDDVIAVGGGMSGTCVFHALRPNALERYRASSSDDNDTEGRNIYPTLTAGMVNESHVILVHGRHIELQARRPTGTSMNESMVMFKQKVPDDIEADNTPIAMHSEEVACVRQRTQTIEVRKLERTGPNLETNGFYEIVVPGAIRGVKYSPDGKLLLVFGGWGVTVFSDGKKVKEKLVASYINNAVVDSSNQWLATTGDAGTGFIYDLKAEWSGDASAGEVFDLESRETVQGLAFDDEGRRLAYFVMGLNEIIVRLAPTPPANETVNEDWKQVWPAIARFSVRDWAWAQVAFSPGPGQWLLCANLAESDRPVSQGSIAIIDADTGLEPDWSRTLRPLALPPGEIHPHNVGWLSAPPRERWSKVQHRLLSRRRLVEDQPQSEDPQQPQNEDAFRPYHLHLYVVVGNEMVCINLTQFMRSHDSDGNFGMLQLRHLTEKKPWLITHLSSRLPHMVNVQEKHTGETILHYCARKEMSEEIVQWLSPRVASAVFTPIEGKYVPGDTLFTTVGESSALHLAIKMQSTYSVKALISNMTRGLNELTGSLATSAIRLMAEKMPEMVRPCMEILYGKNLHGWPTKEHPVSVASAIVVRKLRTERASTKKNFVLVGANHFVYGTIKDLWAGKLKVGKMRRKTDAVTRLVDQKCVLLVGLAGDPDTSPLHSIVKHCDSAVFESDLLRLAVEFKWERNVFPMLQRAMALYAARAILATASILTSTYVGRSTLSDLLAVFLVVAEGASLIIELISLSKQGWRTYFTSIWNLFDVTGPSALIAASVAHLRMSSEQICADGNSPGCEVLQTWGALGVMLKAFSTLDYLRSFRSTGPLVRMLHIISYDVLPFLSILTIVTLGSTLFFMINIPNSSGFDIDYEDPQTGERPVIGKFLPMLTMLKVILSSIEADQYGTVASVVVLFMFALLGVIVMLNLLIAIMGDSYDRQQAKEKVEAIMQMARIIVDYEQTLLDGSFFHGRDVHYPLYLHIAEPAQSVDELGSSDELGISGRISRQLEMMQQRVEDCIQTSEAGTRSEIKELQADISNIYTMLDTGDIRESLDSLLGKGSGTIGAKKRFWNRKT